MTNPTPIAVVTGGSRGIGRSIALALAARGFDLVITWKASKAAADAVVGEIQKSGRKARALQLDVSDTNSFAAFAEQIPHVDVLVNNGASGVGGAFDQVDSATFDQLVAEHFKGPFFLTQALLPKMSSGARVINITSAVTRFTFPGTPVYSSVKAATEALTRALAVELGPRGITVNSVAPGGVATEFNGSMMKGDAIRKMATEQTPLGRMAEPEDIADTVAFLASHDARFVTGQRIELSGGFRL